MKLAYKECRINKTDKQKQATKIIASNETTLLEGGGRSGKTYLFLYLMMVRALKVEGSRHLIGRFRFAHVKQAICYDTMPKLLKDMGQTGQVHLNRSDWFYECTNGSTLWVGGFDDKERTEKILGNEYSTIFINEGSQVSYDTYETLLTRLNPSQGLNAKMWIDYNPPSIQHWGYKVFHKRKFPDGRPVPENDFAKFKMNPCDNPYLDEGYLKRLNLLSEVKRRRFLKGEYSLDSGSLFRRAWIQYDADIPEDFWRIVVAVDPSGTVDGDEIGIIVVGQKGDHIWVLDDFSLHGTPKQWAAEVAAAYSKWNVDIVVAEKNYGGDMVKSTIENAQKHINVKLITSSRGKIVRAEPVSALYEQGIVKHRTMFNDLEDEMCIYVADGTQSPNRMDAMVFGVNELTGDGISMLDAI